MTIGIRAGISKQRGFWLRCFLGRASLAIALLPAASAIFWAKVEIPGPIHLWRLHGFFMDPAGKPIENAEVTLVRDGTIHYKTKTDASGKFAFDHASGLYWLHIEKSNYSEKPNYSQLSREVIVGYFGDEGYGL